MLLPQIEPKVVGTLSNDPVLGGKGNRLPRKNVEILALLLAPVPALTVGASVMRGGGIATGIWILNVTAAVVGLSLASAALAWPEIVKGSRGFVLAEHQALRADPRYVELVVLAHACGWFERVCPTPTSQIPAKASDLPGIR
jgi:hypothetical protein